jgi:hypothetical protein
VGGQEGSSKAAVYLKSVIPYVFSHHWKRKEPRCISAAYTRGISKVYTYVVFKI